MSTRKRDDRTQPAAAPQPTAGVGAATADTPAATPEPHGSGPAFNAAAGTTADASAPITPPAVTAAAANGGRPQIDMVPRAELEAALKQVNTMAAQVAELKRRDDDRARTARELAVNTALDQAVAERKILPSSRDYYFSQCQAEGGLEAFQAHIARLPQMLPDSGLDNAPAPPDPLPAPNAPHNGAPASRPVELTPKQAAFARSAGIEPDHYLANLQARFDKQADPALLA